MPIRKDQTFSDYVHIVTAVSKVFIAFAASIFSAVFRSDSGAPTYWRQVCYSTLKAIDPELTKQLGIKVTPTTVETYERCARALKYEPNIVKLGDGSSACWLGDPDASTIMLYLHGGGYASMAADGHLWLLSDLQKQAESRNSTKAFAILLLQYDVLHQNTYPRQLQQAASALSYLLDSQRKHPSQIIIAGDSAGANLSLALISHMMHPHPSVPPAPHFPDQKNSRLKGLMLLSPWVTFDGSAPSFRKNVDRDLLNPSTLKTWSDAFRGPSAIDNYLAPLLADASWWKDLPAEDVCIIGGAEEIFRDDIVFFHEKIKVHNPSARLHLTNGEAHASPVIDAQFGFPEGTQAVLFKEWVLARTSRVPGMPR